MWANAPIYGSEQVFSLILYKIYIRYQRADKAKMLFAPKIPGDFKL